MKKLALTIAIVLGLGMTSFADPNGGGLFNRGEVVEEGNGRDLDLFSSPLLPLHGETDNQDAPVGSGIVLLSVLGGAYLIGKKRREE